MRPHTGSVFWERGSITPKKHKGEGPRENLKYGELTENLRPGSRGEPGRRALNTSKSEPGNQDLFREVPDPKLARTGVN